MEMRLEIRIPFTSIQSCANGVHVPSNCRAVLVRFIQLVLYTIYILMVCAAALRGPATLTFTIQQPYLHVYDIQIRLAVSDFCAVDRVQ